MEYVYYHCKNHPTNETKYHVCIDNEEDMKSTIERNYITIIVTCSCLFDVDAIAKLNKNAIVEMEGIVNKYIDCRNQNYFIIMNVFMLKIQNLMKQSLIKEELSTLL